MLPNVLQRSAADHVPVLAAEVRELLAVQPGETVVDGTFGAGGHSRLLAADLAGDGKLVAIDRDPGAKPLFDLLRRPPASTCASCAATSRSCSRSSRRTTCAPMRFSSTSACRRCSSTSRSAAFSFATPMRRSTCAWRSLRSRPRQEIVNTTGTSAELADDLPALRRGALGVAASRTRSPSAAAMTHIRDADGRTRRDRCKLAIRRSLRRDSARGDPATRAFQALRIAVNDELGALETALPAALEMLRPGGRLAVISFHSLEDRIVKQFIAEKAKGCTCPPEFPICNCGKQPELRSLTRKPVRPSAREIDANPRSSSARLRVAVKI
jgi:16S rRNA (cytosine1402-N4)-methyltransferase